MDGFGMFGSYKMEMVLGIILHYGHQMAVETNAYFVTS